MSDIAMVDISTADMSDSVNADKSKGETHVRHYHMCKYVKHCEGREISTGVKKVRYCDGRHFYRWIMFLLVA